MLKILNYLKLYKPKRCIVLEASTAIYQFSCLTMFIISVLQLHLPWIFPVQPPYYVLLLNRFMRVPVLGSIMKFHTSQRLIATGWNDLYFVFRIQARSVVSLSLTNRTISSRSKLKSSQIILMQELIVVHRNDDGTNLYCFCNRRPFCWINGVTVYMWGALSRQCFSPMSRKL